MKAGQWEFNHQGIAFYEGGVLADGQHRLAAVVRSDTPISMLVTTGLPQVSGSGIDNHRARSVNDIIRVSGLADWVGTAHAQIIKAIYEYSTRDSSALSPHRVVQLGEPVKGHIMFGAACMKGKKRFITTKPVRAALAMAHAHEDPVRLQEFADIMVSGVPKSDADLTAITLREHLINSPTAGMGGRVMDHQTCMKTMRAIKAFCEGAHLQHIRVQGELIYTLPNFRRMA